MDNHIYNAIQITSWFLLMPQPTPPRHNNSADDEPWVWEKQKVVSPEGSTGQRGMVSWAEFVESNFCIIHSRVSSLGVYLSTKIDIEHF